LEAQVKLIVPRSGKGGKTLRKTNPKNNGGVRKNEGKGVMKGISGIGGGGGGKDGQCGVAIWERFAKGGGGGWGGVRASQEGRGEKGGGISFLTGGSALETRNSS